MGKKSNNQTNLSLNNMTFVAPILMRTITEEEYQNLKKENLDLQTRFLSITHNERLLQETINNAKLLTDENDKLRNENKSLNDKVIELENENKILKNKINDLENKIINLENKNNKFEALVKIHECFSLVNKHFKLEYKKRFNPKRNEYVPNIGECIIDPPIENDDKEYYDFWIYFKTKYPHSDDLRFRKIYGRINNERADNGAHINISDMKQNEFDNLISIALPDIYNSDKNLCNDLRDWMFQFPSI